MSFYSSFFFPDISLEIEGCQSLVPPNVDLRVELLRPLELTVVPDSRTAYSQVGNGRRAYLGMCCLEVERCIALVSDEPRWRFGQASLVHTIVSNFVRCFGFGQVNLF